MRRFSFALPAAKQLSHVSVGPVTHAVKNEVEMYTPATTALTLYTPPVFENRAGNKYWRYLLATLSVFTLIPYYVLPEEGTFVRDRFNREFHYNTHTPLTTNAQNVARWAFILFGTGFAGVFSKRDLSFDLMTKFVERYLEFNYLTKFEENLTPDGKRRVFFRGDQEAEEVLRTNRSPLPFSLLSGDLGLPSVTDPTLNNDGNRPGNTTAVTSLTADIRATLDFGGGEKVLLVVPTKQRIAPTSQHIIPDEEDLKAMKEDRKAIVGSPEWLNSAPPNECEFMSGGVHRSTVLGIAYRNEAGGFVNLVLNPDYSGDIHSLELDEQMRPLLNFLPDKDPRKAILLSKINPELHYRDHFESSLVATAKEHEEQLQKRTAQIGQEGFDGNRLLQAAFKASNSASHFFAFDEKTYKRRREDVAETTKDFLAL